MTTVVTAEMFNLDTDTQAQLAANAISVAPSYFASVSCEGDAILGLKSHCGTKCRSDQQTDYGEASPFNVCARKGLWTHLYRVQQETEALLHWTLSRRYIVEDIPIIPGRNVQTRFGGVSKVNVEELVTSVSYGPFPYSPFLLTGIVPVNVGTDWYVEVPVALLDNPAKLMLRVEDKGTGDPSDGEAVVPVDWPKKPQRVTVGGDLYWRIWIPAQAADGGLSTFTAIHCEQSYFDVTDPSEVECDGVLCPVYPGTVQKIPVIRSEQVGDGVFRFWVRTALMIDPAFDDNYASVADGEFYKFLREVEVRCFGEIQQLAIVTKRKAAPSGSVGVLFPEHMSECDDSACETTTVYACATIINSRLGIIALEEVDVTLDPDTGLPVRDVDGNIITTPRRACVYEGDPISVRLLYKTDPNATGMQLSNAIETLRRAIANRVAAEVPLEDCGCNVTSGFFFSARQVMGTTAYTPTGATIVRLRYGDAYGQQVYAAAMQTAPRINRTEQI